MQLSAYIFVLRWCASDGLVASWSGQISDHTDWLPIHWSGPSQGLEKMRTDIASSQSTCGEIPETVMSMNLHFDESSLVRPRLFFQTVT